MPPGRPRSVTRTIHPANPQPSSCHGCSLYGPGVGYVPASGPLSALQFVGESAGVEELIKGSPFLGAAGGTLTRITLRAGVSRDASRIMNVLSCRPPNDYLSGAPYEWDAITNCQQYLNPNLAMVPDNGVVVTLGGIATRTVLQLQGVEGLQMKDLHGTVWRSVDDRYWVVPTFHPSHLQQGAMSLLEVVTQDVIRARTISQKGFVRSASQLIVDPEPGWFAAWVLEHLRKVDSDPDGTWLALDTEYAEKAGGADEGEMLSWDAQSPITRVNVTSSRDIGITVTHGGAYLDILRTLVAGIAARRGIVWLWNKYADLDHLQAAGYQLEGGEYYDLMWLCHYLQSDLPRGLGFWAPMASDFGAWKHWGKIRAKEGEYAAADALQTFRVAAWAVTSAQQHGLWDVFLRDWHERDLYCLRPAHHMGVPIDRQELEAFHADLQAKQVVILERIKTTTAEGVLKPKLGYAKQPRGKECPTCEGSGERVLTITDPSLNCPTCGGGGRLPLTPPASILGAAKKKSGSAAKQQYMTEGAKLVERTVEVDVRVCSLCGHSGVGAKHRCAKKHRDAAPAADVAETDRAAHGQDLSHLRIERRPVVRWFWSLPFNPDAPAQLLAYIDQQGHTAPEDKKTRKRTTAKKGIQSLAKDTQDPLYQLALDWKAVQKVDSTYAVGTLKLLDSDDRVHPEYLCIPSTLRDSARSPNFTNVVADRGGPAGLASGFRRCIVAREGVPPGVTAEELAAWEAQWG